MRIGIDIDGVLTDIEQFQLDYGSKFYYENYKKEIVNHKEYETYDIFDSNKEIDNLFWNKYFIDYSVNVKARDLSSEVIKKLKEDRNEIYIVTARGSFLSHSSGVMTYDENKKVVKKWLEKNDIYYDKLIFSPGDKLDICLENNIDIMIEDSVHNINIVSTKLPVICFHANYNELCHGENIIRCYSWYDIYAKINNLKNK